MGDLSGPRTMAQFFGPVPDWYKLALIIFLNRKSVNFPHQPFRRWLVAGSGIYFHSGYGPEMLPAAPRWFVGYRSSIHRHDQRGTRP